MLETGRSRFDHILIDCPPSLGLITLNALVAADSVLIPVQAEYLALEGLAKLLHTINLVKNRMNPLLSIEGLVLTMFDLRNNLSSQVARDARDHFGDQVFKTVIPRNVRLSESPSYGKPIILYDVSSIGSQNYMSLVGEVLANHA